MAARFAMLVTFLFIATCANMVLSENLDDIKRKIRFVLRGSMPELLPTTGQPVEVTLGLDLTAIRQVDTTRGEIEILAMRSLLWNNPLLSWKDKSQGFSHDPISIDIKKVWSPDIVAYNAIHPPEVLSPPLAIVNEDGSVMYIPNERIRFGCDLENFSTAEGSNCTLVYGSWTYNAERMNVTGSSVSTNDFRADARFDLLHTYIETEVTYYECCPEPYVRVKITLNIREKKPYFTWWN
ncbi:acetylcholine receptor subunit alpha-like 1 [Elysia marginata]|uniref:Acetylcholine receptor subunit alpha-like 1 n=1 Tax=Elysia marginata TaxID=1093978 RepID=A0AAV4H338_9GAST|nr:acetylcholine receptor subunit alpha-like 1 [Elysia marginata]